MFAAKFDSECPGCGYDIEVADVVGYVEGEVRCGDCCYEAGIWNLEDADLRW